MPYNWAKASEVLVDTDYKRLACVFLNCDEKQVFSIATRDYGSASVESMKVSTRNVLRKIEKAGGKEGGDGTASPAKGAAKKRSKPADIGDDNEPKPKAAKGRKKGKKATAEVEDNTAGGDENGVKYEGNGSD